MLIYFFPAGIYYGRVYLFGVHSYVETRGLPAKVSFLFLLCGLWLGCNCLRLLRQHLADPKLYWNSILLTPDSYL